MRKLTELSAPITPQTVANAMGAWVAMDKREYWYAYQERPSNSKSCWVNGGVTHSIDCLDIWWVGEWQDSLHEPEPEILPGPDGERPYVYDDCDGWYSEVDGLFIGYFDTRVKAIRAWNAVVRSLSDE